MFTGGNLAALRRRLWPMLLRLSCNLAGAGLMTGHYSRYGSVLLGVALMLYALGGVRTLRWSLTASQELWLRPVTGVASGLITAATGVFVIPAVAHLQAIGLEKDELVQALGLAFTLSTLALAGNLLAAGLSGAIGTHLAVGAGNGGRRHGPWPASAPAAQAARLSRLLLRWPVRSRRLSGGARTQVRRAAAP